VRIGSLCIDVSSYNAAQFQPENVGQQAFILPTYIIKKTSINSFCISGLSKNHILQAYSTHASDISKISLLQLNCNAMKRITPSGKAGLITKPGSPLLSPL